MGSGLIHDRLRGKSTAGFFHAVWVLSVPGGDFLTATLTSDAFDPYLVLADTAGGRLLPIEEDDDSGGGTSARIEMELPEGRQVFLVALGTKSGEFDLEVSAVAAPVWETGGDPTERYALLVGIGDYPGWEHDLPGIPVDLDLMQGVLRESFEIPEANILVLRDKLATRRNVINAFTAHLGRAGRDGVAVFYFSGHGIRLGSNVRMVPPFDVEADGRDEALLTGDGSIVVDDEIGVMADRLASDRVLLILDSCYSGTGSRGSGFWLKRASETSTRLRKDLWPDFGEPEGDGSPPRGGDLAPDPDRHVLLAAAREDERAGILAGLTDLSPSDTASVFTYHLARLLMSNPGGFTFQELADSIRTRSRVTARLSDVSEQSPQVLGSSKGLRVVDFLGRRLNPSSPASASGP